MEKCNRGCCGSKAVVMCDDDGNVLERFDTIKEAAEDTGADASTISGCCKGKYIKAGGWKWQYASDVGL